MSKTITLTLKKDLIYEAVKTDTFQRAQAEKSADPVKFASLAYNEAAGDETYHERKLLRLLRSGLAKFVTMMAEFVDSEGGSITYTLNESNDITVRVVVSDRYQNGLANPLSSLAEDYVVYSMDGMWWLSFDATLANGYFAQADNTLTFLLHCLAKQAPTAAGSSYNDVTGEVTGGAQPAIRFADAVYQARVGQAFNEPQPSLTPAGLTLTYASSNNAVATVDATTGEVTPVAAGSCTITASFGGNDTYAPASGSYTLLVTT